jgi:hypothetical protein
MKLLVKVVEARYSDTPQVAILEMNSEFLVTLEKLISRAPVNLEMQNVLLEYFYVNRSDVSSLVKAAEGRMTDWDEFNHLFLESEIWSSNWTKIEVVEPRMILDASGLYFKASDAEGFDYLTAPLTQSDLASTQPKEMPVTMAATA